MAQECQAALEDVCRHVASGGDPREALLVLRDRHRRLAHAVRDAKAHVLEARARVDRYELARQALMYRREHLRACISAARAHPCVFRDIINNGGAPSDMDDGASFTLNEKTLETLTDEDVLPLLEREKKARLAALEAVRSAEARAELARSRMVLRQKELVRVGEHVSRIVSAAAPLFDAYRAFLADAAPLRVLAERLSAAADDRVAVRAEEGRVIVGTAETRLSFLLSEDATCVLCALETPDEGNSESKLLAILAPAPHLALTMPHAEAPPGSNRVALRWVQTAAGLASDTSSVDAESHAREFLSLIP